MRCYLENLEPGTRFRVADIPELTGTLISSTPCSATVQIDGGMTDVAFENHDGTVRRFRANRTTRTTWAPTTLVEPITTPPAKENNMTTTKKKTSARKAKGAQRTGAAAHAKKTATKPAAKKPAGAKANAKPKKFSAIDAAAKVLGESKEPLNTKQMIEQMAAKGYWKSPGGQTPHATLYSALLREIQKKGKDARFKKTDRGHFTLA